MITRRDFLKTTTASLAAVALPSGLKGDNPIQPSERPNLVIVFPDQMRAHAMGFMNQDPVITPNLDQFAKESVVLTQAASNNPICSPCRASLMTGKYSPANGVVDNCTSEAALFDCELRRDAKCWSDILKEKGYSLGYIGKWHLDAPRKPFVDCKNNYTEFAWNEWCPPERRHGFDFWYAYGTYDFHNHPMYWSTRAGRDEFHVVDQWGPIHETDMALQYLANAGGQYRDSQKPFALMVAMNPPHDDQPGLYEAVPEKYLDDYTGSTWEDLINRPNVNLEDGPYSQFAKEQTKGYFAMVTGVDDQFGRILNALEEQNLADNTIVLFMSDHGNCIGNHDWHGKAVPYEEAMRIPFLIRWPQKLRPHQDDLLISIPDIYPTLMDLMGFKDAIPQDVQGASYARLLLGGDGPRPSSQPFFHIPLINPAVGERGVRTHRYTLAIDRSRYDRYQTTLYNNQDDPYQLVNIAKDHPQIVQELIKNELEPWLKRIGDPWKLVRK